MKRIQKFNISIKGNNWAVFYCNHTDDDSDSVKNAAGITDISKREIFIYKDSHFDEDWSPEIDKPRLEHTLRHELIHAFVKECGLGWEVPTGTPWPVNEECVDFYASVWLDLNKIIKAASSELNEVLKKSGKDDGNKKRKDN